jgi:hypothetical protein
MENEAREKRAKNYSLMRSLLDYTMGLLYLGGGLFLIFANQLGFEMESFDKTFRYIFGGLCIVYGSWRIYRGYKKEYF